MASLPIMAGLPQQYRHQLMLKVQDVHVDGTLAAARLHRITHPYLRHLLEDRTSPA